jgi:hypothetical protein
VKVVGLPGFEPGSRDPQPRSIGQTNLQALGLSKRGRNWSKPCRMVTALWLYLISGYAERGNLIEEVYVTYEHPPAAVSLDT